MAQRDLVAGSPCTRMRTRPLMFWPKSTTVTSLGDCSIATGRNVSMRRTGGPVGATIRSATDASSSTAIQSLSSNPGVVQPGSASLASYVSPS